MEFSGLGRPDPTLHVCGYSACMYCRPTRKRCGPAAHRSSRGGDSRASVELEHLGNTGRRGIIEYIFGDRGYFVDNSTTGRMGFLRANSQKRPARMPRDTCLEALLSSTESPVIWGFTRSVSAPHTRTAGKGLFPLHIILVLTRVFFAVVPSSFIVISSAVLLPRSVTGSPVSGQCLSLRPTHA